ncbi:MFS transporter [Burkholderia sp. S171]|uniref:MFS transporter n=1 Tax=Burkholderia sp. S171 TaxID=1641860 RepID=UPI00131C08FF|nr:MFS transporter [Burkholderia sp. S171]
MTAGDKAINVTELIDGVTFTRLQFTVVALCALVGLLDGADTQSIGVAAPFIASALGHKVSGFGPVFAAAQLGATVGALTFGPLADRVGRKPMLILAIMIFAAFTLATTMVTSLPALVAVRFFAGLGLGGATPCFLTLTSDYSPRKQRGMIATIIWSAYPLGAALGSFMNAYILSHFGWQAIFYIGGGLPLLVAGTLVLFLPESVQYLAARGAEPSRIRKILRRMGHAIDDKQTAFVVEGKKLPGVPIKHLFNERRGLPTVLLWAVFFLAFATTNVMTMWTPTLLHANGLAPAATAIVLAFFNIGAFLGMAAAGRLVDKFGPTAMLVPAFLAAALSIAALGGATSVGFASLFGALLGVTIGIGGAGAIAIASLVYPTAIRSTAIGWGMGSARFGQFVSPLIIGGLLTAGLATGQILIAAALFPVLGAIFVALLWLQGRGSKGGAAGSAVGATRETH